MDMDSKFMISMSSSMLMGMVAVIFLAVAVDDEDEGLGSTMVGFRERFDAGTEVAASAVVPTVAAAGLVLVVLVARIGTKPAAFNFSSRT